MPYGAYDEFAWCYNKGWGQDYHREVQPVLNGRIFPRLSPAARVLDLCCGTGDLSVVLAGRGYRITGLDGSAEMLNFARERVPGADFLLDDARTFRIESAFDAVLSTFDSLNHVLTLAELHCVFSNVVRALVPGGLFVFDLNMEECFETLWRGSFATVEDVMVSVTRGHYDASEKLGRAEITMFRSQPGENWKRIDVTVYEKCYTRDEVVDALAAAGFSDIESRDAYELGMRTDIAVGRTFFFARKTAP